MPIVIGAIGTISVNAKAWYGRLSLHDIRELNRELKNHDEVHDDDLC